MTGNIKINIITELINSLEDLDISINNISNSNNESNDIEVWEKNDILESVNLDLKSSNN